MKKLRFKFWGQALPVRMLTADAGEFKEGEHPRAGNGQFTSGAGAGGKQVFGGVTAPKKGTSAHNIWTYAAQCEEQGKPVNTANVLAAAEAAGVTLNKSNTGQTLPLYKKFQKGAKESGATGPVGVTAPAATQPAAPAPKPKLENNAETFATISEQAGLTKEGVYGGITYYKNGSTKASYDPSSKSWQIKKPDGSTEKGSDINDLAEKLKVDTAIAMELAKSATAKAEAAKTANEAAAKKATAAAHSTLNAALYGHKAAVQGSHQFSSKGAANETALSAPLRKSLNAYTGSYYKPINKAMRFAADASAVDHDVMNHIFNLQQAFRAVPPTTQDIQVGRKVGLEALKTMARDAGVQQLDELQPGQILRDTGVISTSHSKSVWSGAVQFNIRVPKGSKAIDLSETMNKGEQEMLLPPGSGLKITSIKKSPGGTGYLIDCEHVA